MTTIDPIVIYLDQNKWVDLMKARLGRTEAMHLRPVFDMLLRAARRGVARFPLSSVHYMETWKRQDEQSRKELADTMLCLARPGLGARPFTIAHALEVARMEMDEALKRRFGRPEHPRKIDIVGRGYAHAFGRTNLKPSKYMRPLASYVTSDSLLELEGKLAREEETGILRQSETDKVRFKLDNKPHEEFSVKYAQRERYFVEEFTRLHATKARKREHLSYDTLREHLYGFVEAITLAHTSPEEFGISSTKAVDDFIADVPTMNVHFQLQVRRHDDPGFPREKGDLGDLTAFSVAIPHCNIVVLEKRVHAMAMQLGFENKYKSVLLRDLRQIQSLLPPLK